MPLHHYNRSIIICETTQKSQQYRDNVTPEFFNRTKPKDYTTKASTMKDENIDHISYREYKAAGDYWNKYPKTDYTYSPMSPFRREVVPGVVAMPNMSRKSLKKRSRSICRLNISSHLHLQKSENNPATPSDFKNVQIFSGNNALSPYGESLHKWNFYYNIFNKVSRLFSSVHPLHYEKSQYRCNWQPILNKTSFENMDDWFLVNFIRLSLRTLTITSNTFQTLYIAISSVLHIDTLLLRSKNIKNYIRHRFWITMLLLLLLLMWTVFYTTEYPNNSVYPVQSLISLLYINVHHKIFSTDPRKRLTYNLNGFWISLQSLKLLRRVNLKMQLDSAYCKKARNEFYNHIRKTTEESEAGFYTKTSSYNKVSITDLLAINWLVWIMPSKGIDFIWRRSFEEYNDSPYVNHILVYNTLYSFHQFNQSIKKAWNAANKNTKRKAFNIIQKDIELLKFKYNTGQNTSFCLKINKACSIYDDFWKMIDSDELYLSQIKQLDALQFENKANVSNWYNELRKNKDINILLHHYSLSLHENCQRTFKESISRLLALLKQNLMATIKMEIRKSVYFNESKNRFIRTEKDMRDIINDIITTYDADKTGRVDYALETAGGQVLSTRCTENYNTKAAQISIFGIPLWTPSNSPRIAISPSVHPGECWAFQGFPGFLVVKLNTLVYVTGFTIEHVWKSLTPYGRIDSAPKNFSVWGLLNEDDRKPTLFGEYQFLDNNIALQYFPVKSKAKGKFKIIELKIESNHGNELYTCLYRFRVHGTPF